MKTFTFLLALCWVGLLAGPGLRAQTFVQFSINQPAAPNAAFTYSVQNTTYTMSDQSTGAGLTYSWVFGDGGVSTLQNPVYTYGTEGNFTVCLTITDGNNCTSSTCDSILVVGLRPEIPGLLMEIAPNPFTGQTSLEYTLPHDAQVNLAVYDLLGARVQSLAQGTQAAGRHRYRIGTDLAAGTYLLVLEAEGKQLSRRIVKAQ